LKCSTLRNPRASQEREFLLDALSRYMRLFFPAWLHQASGASNVARRRAEHLPGNVLKLLQHLDIPAETRPRGSFADRILQVFDELSRVYSRINHSVDEVADVVCPGTSAAVEDAIPSIEAFSSDGLKRGAEVIHGPAPPQEQLAYVARLRHSTSLPLNGELREGLRVGDVRPSARLADEPPLQSTQDGDQPVLEELEVLRQRLTS